MILALLQGLTEFLPISSSAHLILPAALFGWSDQGLAFDIGVHVGSLAAVIGYFRAALLRLTVALFAWIRHRRVDEQTVLLGHLIVATLPIVVIGYLAKDWVSGEARSMAVIATTTGLFGLLLLYADRRAASAHPATGRTEMQLTWRDAMVIGCFQVLAIIPGTSRSGITMTAGRFLNLTREASARFSFLLSVPTILGAGVLVAADAFKAGTQLAAADLALGVAISGLAAYSCIAAFVALIERIGMMPFVIYRVVLSLVLFSLVFGGFSG